MWLAAMAMMLFILLCPLSFSFSPLSDHQPFHQLPDPIPKMRLSVEENVYGPVAENTYRAEKTKSYRE